MQPTNHPHEHERHRRGHHHAHHGNFAAFKSHHAVHASGDGHPHDPHKPPNSLVAAGQTPARATVQISEKDIHHLAAIAHAEAGNQGMEGMMGVVAAVINRVASGLFGSSVQDVLKAKGQFEPVAKHGIDGLPPPSAEAKLAVRNIISGNVPDPTNGATFFQNPHVTAKRHTQFASNGVDAQRIGDHVFQKGYGGKPIAVPEHIEIHYADKGQTHVGVMRRASADRTAGNELGQKSAAQSLHADAGNAHGGQTSRSRVAGSAPTIG